MKILALERDTPGTSPVQFAPHLEEEARCVWQLYQEGLVRELYFRADRHEAVLILECATTAEAQGLLDDLPLVREGLITFDLIPLIPYTGFARLFESVTASSGRGAD